MTEREKMRYAKSLIDKLVRGIDPYSGAEVGSDSLLSNARLLRCFIYVSELIEKLIIASDENGEIHKPPRAHAMPELTPERLSRLTVSEDALAISIIAKRISAELDPDGGASLPATLITEWLVKKGFLERVENKDPAAGRSHKEATPEGERLGIRTVDSSAPNGAAIRKNVYDRAAQRYIIENLREIIESH